MKIDRLVEELSRDLKKEKAGEFEIVSKIPNDYYSYKFNINGLNFLADFSKDVIEGEDRNLDVFDFEFLDNKGEIKMSGHGKVSEVFSTIAEIVKDFVKRETDAIISFEGLGRSRMSYYRRLAKEANKVLPSHFGIEVPYPFDKTAFFLLYPKHKEEEVKGFKIIE